MVSLTETAGTSQVETLTLIGGRELLPGKVFGSKWGVETGGTYPVEQAEGESHLIHWKQNPEGVLGDGAKWFYKRCRFTHSPNRWCKFVGERGAASFTRDAFNLSGLVTLQRVEVCPEGSPKPSR